jgi:chromosome segregation ATPase
LQNEVDNWKAKYNQLQAENDGLKNSGNESKGIIHNLKIEINQFVTKVRDFEDLDKRNSDKIRGLEIDLENLKREFELLRKKYDQKDSDLKLKQSECKKLFNEKNMLGKEFEEYRGQKEAQLAEFNNKLKELERVNYDLESSIRELNMKLSEMDRLKAQLEDFKANQATLQAKFDALWQEKNGLESLISKLRMNESNLNNQLQHIQKDIAQKSAQIEDLNARLSNKESEYQKLSSEFRQLKSVVINLQSERDHLIAKIERYDGDMNHLREQNSALDQELRKSRNDMEALQRNLIEIKSRLDSSEAQNKKLVEQRTKMDRELSEKSRELDEINGQCQILQREKMSIQGELDLVKQRIDDWKERYQRLEIESKEIIDKLNKERDRMFEKNQRLEFIASDRLQEIEKKSWENEKLLLRIGLAYAELNRLFDHKLSGSSSKLSSATSNITENLPIIKEVSELSSSGTHGSSSITTHTYSGLTSTGNTQPASYSTTVSKTLASDSMSLKPSSLIKTVQSSKLVVTSNSQPPIPEGGYKTSTVIKSYKYTNPQAYNYGTSAGTSAYLTKVADGNGLTSLSESGVNKDLLFTSMTSSGHVVGAPRNSESSMRYSQQVVSEMVEDVLEDPEEIVKRVRFKE